MVEKNQMGGEKAVLLIGSPMCCITMIKSQKVVERHARRPGGQGVITTMMRDANRVSEVKYKNFVEQWVRHLLGNAGRLFLHETLWDRWSRGLTKSGLFVFSEDKILFQVEIRAELVTEELGICCCNKGKRTKIHVKNVMMMLLRGLSYVAFTDSESIRLVRKKLAELLRSPT